MIKILTEGYRKYELICKKCDCRFSYEIEDVIGNLINCPYCGFPIVHSSTYGVDKREIKNFDGDEEGKPIYADEPKMVKLNEII